MNKRQRELFSTDPPPWEFDDAADILLARVVFPQAPYGPYDYRVPDRMRESLAAGCRVRVPLGRGNRGILGYCVQLGDASQLADAPEKAADAAVLRRWKDIKSQIDARPLLTPSMLRLTEWMSSYYRCGWGQVLDAVVPSGVRVQAGTRETTFLRAPNHVVARITQLKLPPKQAQALRVLAASARPMTPPELAAAVGCTMAPIKALRAKKLVEADVRRVPRGVREEPPPAAPPPRLRLNPPQESALEMILDALRAPRYDTILLHGVTGSGKTEVYIRAIEEVIRFGRQAIVLVPEISLTPQTRQRFRSRFERVAVLHSHLSDSDRHWHWRRIADGEIQVVVGARSAVFAPTPSLGLIVMDEEHDASFKQDMAPRYHARDVAMQRAEREGVPLVLGSATPSLESYYRAQTNEFRFADLPGRVLDRPLPHVSVIDLRNEFRSRRFRGGISWPLREAMRRALEDGGQVILLLNRRGFSTSIQCGACGHVVVCPECDIALTHHHHGEAALCHYCDYRIDAPSQCPECRFDGIRYSGFGTQRLEAEVRSRFPSVTCLRMDGDTMQRPGSHERALDRFRSGEVQVLLGTQMIAKGLDFPEVTLVGVINADTALHFPDFRAAERTFQLVTQVAGRTGRGDRGGRVLVQTFSPEHPAIQAAARHDYIRFASQELPARREFGYPPWSSMVRLIVRGPDESVVESFAEQLSERVQSALETFGDSVRLLGPAPAPIAKLRGKFRHHIMLLGADAARLGAAVEASAEGLKLPEGLHWAIDIDPVDML